MELYLDEKLDSRKIAKMYGCSFANVCKQLKKLGITRQQKGKTHSQWNGGRSKHGQSGYWTVYAPEHPRKKSNNRVFEHILIAEKKYNKQITKATPIHHIDFDRLNNDPKNLYLCEGHKEHRDIHCSLEEIARELFRQGNLGFKDGKYYWK